MHVVVDNVQVVAQRELLSPLDHAGNISLNMGALNGVPRVGGAVDLMRLLQYTPGVALTQEGTTAMYVRGGDAGQSLILLDGAPLYSPSHFLGFFSTLNTPHLSGLTLYKSGIPAMYGSSTAAVVDIRTRRHIPERFGIEANVGLVESDAALQIPINNRFAIFLSARHSYTSWLTQRIVKQGSISYHFGDYGVGFAADLGRVGRLTMNTHFNNDYAGVDAVIFNSRGELNWWNALGTLRLESIVGERLVLENVLYASIYDNHLRPTIVANSYDIRAGVGDYGLKSSVKLRLAKLNIAAGVDYAFRRVRPQHIFNNAVEGGVPIVEQSSEAAIYGSVRWEADPHLNIDAGLRLSLFAHDRVWAMPEPRLSLEIPINADVRLWGGYNLMMQYIHLVPQSNMSFATDFYLSSSEFVPPQQSHNFTLGYGHQTLQGTLRWSVELYYRYMTNIIEYNSAILDVLMGTGEQETMLYRGRGESYGVETSLGYISPKLDVQLCYTLSKSLRQFDEINYGVAFPANSDRRHSLTLIGSYRPSERWTLGATFAYATGAPYTEAVAVYLAGNIFLREFGAYNAGRLPDLHHLDLSATYWFRTKRLQCHGINLSIYNLYAHRNPLMLSLKVAVDEEGKRIEIREHQHFVYTIIPSISWTIKF